MAAGTVDVGLTAASFGTKGIVEQGVKRIVIGETSERVAKKALEIGAEYYIPRKTVQEIGIDRALRNNYQWLRQKYLQGYKYIDEGLDLGRKDRGLFYAAESRWRNLWGWKSD